MLRVWLRKPRSPHEYGAAEVLMGAELLKMGVYHILAHFTTLSLKLKL